MITTNSHLANSASRFPALERLALLVQRDRATTIDMLRCLVAVDSERSWAAEGYPSLFALCVERFRMSESAAFKRIRGARLGQRFPAILEMIGRGELNLSTLCVLSPHLTEENCKALLRRAAHKSKREVEAFAAELAPKPEASARVVALVRPRSELPPGTASRGECSQQAPASGPVSTIDKEILPGSLVPGRVDEAPVPSVPTPSQVGLAVEPARESHGRIEATGRERCRLHVTLGADAHEDLRKLQGLLGHVIPGGDPAAIVARALRALVAQAARDRAAETDRPGKRPTGAPAPKGRTIPRAVAREVWQRDGGRCAFVGASGKRCGTTHRLELHHIVPFARGGEATAPNLALRCRAHNHFEAVLDYGEAFMHTRRGSEPKAARESVGSYGLTKRARCALS